MFIPLSDDNPIESIDAPWVTRALIATNIAVFILFQQEAVIGQAAMQARIATFGVVPAALTQILALPQGFGSLPEDLTVLTYMFLHGSWLHLGANMLFLWVFGDNIEDALGRLRFLLFYLSCGIAAAITHTLAMPDSEVPLIGASGAVAGCVAAYLILHPRVKLWVLAFMRIPLRLSAMWALGAWIGLQFVNAWGAGETGTAWWAHVGGLIAGAALVVPLRRPDVPLFDRGLVPGRRIPLPPPLPGSET